MAELSINRRDFLALSVGLAAASLPPARLSAAGTPAEVTDSSEPQRSEAVLDLAQHGELALNGVLGSLNPNLDHECVFLSILDTNPPYMLHWSTMVSGVMPKYLEALPLLRVMTGSDSHRSLEEGFLAAVLANMKEDGLLYDRALPQRPWNVGVYYGRKDWNEDYANIAGNGRGLTGLLYMHQFTGDGAWLNHARRTAERLLELAIIEDGMAWYPNPGLGNDFSYPRLSGWTTRKAPERADEGFEGAAMFYLFQPLRGFSRYFQATGDERFLELSRKLMRFGRQRKFWGGARDIGADAAAERGHFRLHFHASMAAVRGVLDHAIADNDAEALEFASNSYGYARQMGINRLGLFPTSGERVEGCTIADMIGMAVALTDAGLGDYWDDVECYARNGLICAQATDLIELRRVSSEGRVRPPGSLWGGQYDIRFRNDNRGVLPGQEIHDRVLERSHGAFGHLMGARYLVPQMMHCCTANCAQGLYYAWEGITRSSGASATVNMWLSRTSPWLDIESHVPHSGRIDLRNKGMERILVRTPSWARAREVRCQIDGQDVSAEVSGSRLLLTKLRGNESISIMAPIRDMTFQATMLNLADPAGSRDRYDIRMRGHTAMSVQPLTPEDGGVPRNWYRLFRNPGQPNTLAQATGTKPNPNGRIVRWNVV